MKLIGSIFSIIGLSLIATALLLGKSQQSFLRKAHTAPGTVIELVWNRSVKGYAPVVQYTTGDGRPITFRSNVSFNPPAYEAGEAVTVYYDPDNPQDAQVKGPMGQWFIPGLFGLIGIVFAGVGGKFLVSVILGSRRKKWLMQHGQTIRATFTGVQLNTSFKINRRSPYQVHCQWLNPQTGQMHVFRSEDIWHDPSIVLNGHTVEVKIDRNNLTRYYVDLSKPPQLTQ